MAPADPDIRFTPESGHVRCTSLCLLWANSGHKAVAAGALAGRRGAMTTAHTQQQTIASQDRVLVGTLKLFQGRAIMIVTITTFNLAQPTTLDEITKTFQVTAPKYQGVAGLLSKNYWMSEDGRRVGGIYIWETRADADRLHTAEWKKFVEGKYGTAPQIEYLHSPVMVDNRDGSIKVAA
jgi:hypothetical protein